MWLKFPSQGSWKFQIQEQHAAGVSHSWGMLNVTSCFPQCEELVLVVQHSCRNVLWLAQWRHSTINLIVWGQGWGVSYKEKRKKRGQGKRPFLYFWRTAVFLCLTEANMLHRVLHVIYSIDKTCRRLIARSQTFSLFTLLKIAFSGIVCLVVFMPSRKNGSSFQN